MSEKLYYGWLTGFLFLFSTILCAESLEQTTEIETVEATVTNDSENDATDLHSAITSLSSQFERTILLDQIVAIVNEEVITLNELDLAVATAKNNLIQQNIEPPDLESLQGQVLETLVMKSIQLQHAKEIGMSVSDSELDETILRIADENQLSLQEFYAVLEQDGIGFNQFRKDIRDEIIMARLRERQISSQVNVTEGEVDNFLRTQETSATGNEEYLLAHIYISVTEHMDNLKILEKSQRAEEALKRLQDGAEFSHVAAEFSDAPDAMSGGVMDWRPITQMGPTFAQLLSPLEIDEITPVVQSPTGFHIFKLLDRREQEIKSVIVDQTHARHILIKVSELTSENDAKQQIKEIKKRIDNGENFAELAKLYSEDGSASSGGDLGWLSPGNTVAPFEKAMDALLPGQISDPVQSQFGWHLIQVLERRTQDVSDESRRDNARQSIRSRKAEVVIQDFLRQLRDQAYVEYLAEDV
ncbi:MAG: peptidylprolyl isomerase [Nitrosomonas sp.]|nr:peptidylprolyl isomerase [Nitrosomonas sp.]